MNTRARVAVVVLAAWTAFVWITRINNVLAGNDMGAVGKTLTVLLSLSMLGLAAASVWSAWTAKAPWVIPAFAGWTVVVWVVRVPTILLIEIDLGFRVVHTMLGVISIGLALLAWRLAVSSEREPAGTLA